MIIRRPNGSGSVSKLPGNRRKPWRARKSFILEGRQLWRTVGYYATKREAAESLVLDGVIKKSEYESFTLKELFEEWKKSRAYLDLSKSTQWTYDAAFLHMSMFYNVKFNDLRSIHFQQIIDKTAADGKGQSTLKHIKTLISIISKYSEGKEKVRLPKPGKRDIPIFTETERMTLFKNDSVPLVDTILILIYTGMRITELLTLTKFNVDIKNMVIVGGIKTEAGKDRPIPIHPKIQKYIEDRYNQSENYLIENNGKPYLVHHYRKLYYDTLESLSIRRLTPHKARHTFATMVTSKSKDRHANAMLLGHTEPNFTEKTYDHPDIDRLRDTIEKIDI